MLVERTNYGLKITIPETGHNSEFTYQVRQVRTLNNNDPREQKLLAELEKGEKTATRRLLLLLWSMENFFNTLPNDWAGWWGVNDRSPFEIWEQKNRLDFNEYYHTGARLLIEQIDGFSLTYCDKSRHGWCY